MNERYIPEMDAELVSALKGRDYGGALKYCCDKISENHQEYAYYAGYIYVEILRGPAAEEKGRA